MAPLTYTEPELVTETTTTVAPSYGQTVSGYGGKIPTRHLIRYAGRWHRVYMMQYGNSGSPYIVKAGQTLHLDIDTEHRLNNN